MVDKKVDNVTTLLNKYQEENEDIDLVGELPDKTRPVYELSDITKNDLEEIEVKGETDK